MRSVLMMVHTARSNSVQLAAEVRSDLRAAGFEVRMLADEAENCAATDIRIVDEATAADGAELVLVLGGDGTFLRAAEVARPAGVPMLGVNLGHVGFLAEVEPAALGMTVQAMARGDLQIEERVTVDAEIFRDGAPPATAWALNEVSVERSSHGRVLEIAVAVEGRPLLRFGCDGVLCSTPTGSTAYAFSAGGPIVWPDVDAFLLVPNAAHALFARPIVLSPSRVVDIELLSAEHDAVLSCDGRRSMTLPAGSRIRMRRGAQPIRIARLPEWSFADRLVTKFQLPVRGFRDAGADRHAAEDAANATDAAPAPER